MKRWTGGKEIGAAMAKIALSRKNIENHELHSKCLSV
jgi:hypothetical protein